MAVSLKRKLMKDDEAYIASLEGQNKSLADQPARAEKWAVSNLTTEKYGEFLNTTVHGTKEGSAKDSKVIADPDQS